jgi:hypothetical protein
VSAKAFDPVTGTEMAFATVFNATIVPMSSFPIRAHVNLNLTALIATAVELRGEFCPSNHVTQLCCVLPCAVTSPSVFTLMNV